MKKIPTLFVRDPDDRRHVIIGEVTPGCEWVLAGEGQASRKWDGTCVRISHGTYGPAAWPPVITVDVRHTVKRGDPPAGFEEVEHDPVTGKTVGWLPYRRSGFARYIEEALGDDLTPETWEPGTYELIGPKINGNPDRVPNHRLERHGNVPAFIHLGGYPGPAEAMAGAVRQLSEGLGWEGLVWRHVVDGRMAKLKARDLPEIGS